MGKADKADSRWTVRFSPDDLHCVRRLAQVCAHFEKSTAGRVVRQALERFAAEKFGAEPTRRFLDPDEAALASAYGPPKNS
jgi:hypothetical protein